MPIIAEISLPKGSSGMTQLGGTNDDSTVSLPDMGFNFYYNGSVIRQLYSSGNSWVGFGSGSQHLNINNRDASYNRLLYANEVEHGIKLFRIRFEGNYYYSNWGANNLVWELSVFETGVIRLVLEKFPNNGTNNFANPNVGTVTLSLSEGKSYIFSPLDPTGKNYTIQEGSYIPAESKFLMVDTEGVKTYGNSAGVMQWYKIGELPLTENIFKTYGIEMLPNSLEGLIDDAPLLFHYTDNPNILANKNAYQLKLTEVVTSRPLVLLQNFDFEIHEGKLIDRFEIEKTTSKRDANGNEISTNGRIYISLSVDMGSSFLTFNAATSSFETININDLAAFKSNGIAASALTGIDYDELNARLQDTRKIRFAYLLEKPTLEDVCKLRKIKIFYR
ncbi:hypothetical protein [Clostridium thermarum]|uniref:hypothetical protein n=1 Tax=Clostridium thermarum TaxID=1716543 RepID=UPI0011200DD9|nr:hypothetical protein [Clostridium thermarum]